MGHKPILACLFKLFQSDVILLLVLKAAKTELCVQLCERLQLPLPPKSRVSLPGCRNFHSAEVLEQKKNTWEPRLRLDLSRQLTAGLNIELTLWGEVLKWKESCKPSALCTFALGSVQI